MKHRALLISMTHDRLMKPLIGGMDRFTMVFAEQFTFLRDWLSDPLRVAAIAPSSHSLAEIITAEITKVNAPVIELGPGTGVFTRRLIQRGVPQERLALVESGHEFAKHLDWKFPVAQVLCMDACKLNQVELFDGELAGAVISGLPCCRCRLARSSASCDPLSRTCGQEVRFTNSPTVSAARSPSAFWTAVDLERGVLVGLSSTYRPAAVYKISRRNTLICRIDHEPLQSHKIDTMPLVCP